MLKELTIHNFQCHRDVALSFVQGVNVIAGTSDAGKSAILKALLWVLTNRPQGLAFRSWQCAKGDTVSVKLTLDDFVVTRWRDERSNEYVAESKTAKEPTRYVAMKSDVPSDLDKVLNLAPVNIQTQFQPHFLLAVSSAEVSRVLNDACDLSVIDTVVRGITGISNAAKATVTATEQELERLNVELNSLAWADGVEKMMASVQAEYGRIVVRQNAVDTLQSLIEALLTVHEYTKEAYARLDAMRSVDAVAELVTDVASQEVKCQQFAALIDRLRSVDVKLKDIHTLPDDILAKADKACSGLTEIGESVERMEDVCSALSLIEAKIRQVKRKQEEIEDKIRAFWKETPICPLCGQEVNHG